MPPFFNLVIMNIRHSLLGLFLPLSLFSCHTVEKEAVGRPLSSYVNPFVGASTNTELAGASHGLGKTFPGATAPFGMVQVSPNTITGGDNGPAIVMSIRLSKDSHLRKCPVSAGTAIWGTSW